MAFSSILEGPSDEAIGQFVNQAIPVLLAALSDENDLVKDTTAWTIGRICDLHVRSIPEDTFPTLVNGLAGKLLTESPRVSSQACFGIHNLAAAFQNDNAAATSGTNALSSKFFFIWYIFPVSISFSFHLTHILPISFLFSQLTWPLSSRLCFKLWIVRMHLNPTYASVHLRLLAC